MWAQAESHFGGGNRRQSTLKPSVFQECPDAARRPPLHLRIPSQVISTPSVARLPGKRSSGKAPQRCRLGPEDYYSRRPNSRAAGSLLWRGGDENQRSGRVSGFCVTPPSGGIGEVCGCRTCVLSLSTHVCALFTQLAQGEPRPGSLTKASVARLSLWVETNDPDITTKTSWIPKHIYFLCRPAHTLHTPICLLFQPILILHACYWPSPILKHQGCSRK